jgi:LmbE family N-acetylglucosaminyl deacetylase
MRRLRTSVTFAALVLLALVSTLSAAAGPKQGPVKLNVLFIGAHPDDEAFTIPAFGQWLEDHGLKTGVVTITRGEGGGNAVGPEEGPPLGILREGEERRAVGMAGITDIFYLDTVDFYYTVSSPLTEQIWGHDATLAKIVRLVRETRPDVIVTMDPAPVPGQHGNHQFAGRLAVEAYNAAADPNAFPEQLKGPEKLDTWDVKRLFRDDFSFSPAGPSCASSPPRIESTDDMFGVWMGTRSAAHGGLPWWHILWDAAHQYLSQGFGAFPSPPDLDFIIPCNWFTQIASRVPFDPTSTDTTAIFQGAAVPAPGGLDLGTELSLTSDRFEVAAGVPFHVTAHALAAKKHLDKASVALTLPAGWTVSGNGSLGNVDEHHGSTATFTVTPDASATAGRYRIEATLTAKQGTGTTDSVVRVVPAVQGQVQRLPQVEQFEQWARDVAEPQLGGRVKPVLPIGVGETRSVRVDLHNWSGSTQSGTVTMIAPAGFGVTPASQPYSGLAAGASSSVTFQVTNTDTSLATSNQGGGGTGDYDTVVTTTSGAGSSAETFGLELVPSTAIPQSATPPTVDGVEGAGEYSGATLDVSRVWEGDACTSAADCSATAKVTRSGDDLYFVVHVTDDVLGTKVTPADCKRHWRTDSVEITLDPRGTAENTSTTFKTGIFPTTTAGTPCFERDADNHQGDASTAPGMQVASVVSSPYGGYTIEAKIPLADLPAATDPQHLGMNILVYDSDTQDLTGQTRLAWSPYGGVQGDPYRWGHATLPGYVPPAGRPTTPSDPIIPMTAALSVDSPQSILQSATDGVPLAGGPAAERGVKIVGKPELKPSSVTLKLDAKEPGTAHVFAWTGTASVAELVVPLEKGPPTKVTLPIDAAAHDALAASGQMLVSFAASGGGTESLAETLR